MSNLREHARTMRAASTVAERTMWRILKSSPLEGWHFRRQAVFEPLYIADFASHAARLIVEVDGPSHELTAPDDAVRTEWFRAKGFRVLRFSNAQVLRERDAVWRELCAALPTETPPPRSR